MRRLKTYELFGFGNKKPRFEIDPKIEIIGNKLEKMIIHQIDVNHNLGFENSKTWHVYRKGRNPQTGHEISINIIQVILGTNDSVLFEVRPSAFGDIGEYLKHLINLYCIDIRLRNNYRNKTGMTAKLTPDKFDDFVKDLNEEGLEMFSDIGKYNL